MEIARIVCLSTIYDQNYHDLRGELIERILSAVKRVELFQCLKAASGGKVIVLSPPPKATYRRSMRWLPAVETKFGSLPQFVCCNWDVPKLRVPLSWFFFARHVLQHTKDGDLVLLDNFEFIHIVAAYFIRPFRKVTFILDYEDGKHLIDRSWPRVLSGIAEAIGRRLIQGAILVHPAMKNRLRAALPTVLIPGFISDSGCIRDRDATREVRFLYSGSLDATRGVDLLLKALEQLPDSGWHLDISGAGLLAAEVERAATSAPLAGKISFHRTLSDADFRQLVASAQVGLNCQRISDPISEVTFPSKVFSYLSADLMVLSSTAGAVREICGEACVYFEEETPESLAAAMREIIRDYASVRQRLKVQEIRERYSRKATAVRLHEFLEAVQLSR